MSWQSWQDAYDKGPEAVAMKGCGFIVFIVIPILVVLGGIGYVGGWFSEAGRVAKQELGPAAILRKYEWFKDAAAALDAKAASIQVYRKRFDNLKSAYAGAARSAWSREDREQSNLWEQELAGIKSSYNRLAAEFNAAHAKIHWAFADLGNVPQGGKVLPREFREYLED